MEELHLRHDEEQQRRRKVLWEGGKDWGGIREGHLGGLGRELGALLN